MKPNRIDSNIRCPSCNGQLFPRVLVCDSCGLKVEGNFIQNEFGSLTPDELHFLRVFIYCEGGIRDMEAALGVSYPTVKAKLASIKEKLNLLGPRFKPAAGEGQAAEKGASQAGHPRSAETPQSEDSVLDRLEKGEIDYKEAVALLKSRKKGDIHGKQGGA